MYVTVSTKRMTSSNIGRGGVVDFEIVQHRPVDRERLTVWPPLLQSSYVVIFTLGSM